MAKNTLIMTVGLPRSGKSTWALKQGVPIVCPDSIRIALHGQRYYPTAEQFVWALAKLMVRSLFHSGHRAVILDATSSSAARRMEWNDPDWRRVFVVFDVGADECIQRAKQGGREDLIPVIERMSKAGQFQLPMGYELGQVFDPDSFDLERVLADTIEQI